MGSRCETWAKKGCSAVDVFKCVMKREYLKGDEEERKETREGLLSTDRVCNPYLVSSLAWKYQEVCSTKDS